MNGTRMFTWIDRNIYFNQRENCQYNQIAMFANGSMDMFW
jgi:hypothetical protein